LSENVQILGNNPLGHL